MTPRIMIRDIKQAVAEHYRVEVELLEGPLRTQRPTRIRNMAFWLCRELTKASFPEIGRAFGDRDHSTVMHGVQRIQARSQVDAETAASFNQLRAQLIDAAPHTRAIVWAFPFKSRRTVPAPAPVFIRRHSA